MLRLLTPGAAVGPYTLVCQLDNGGQGQVWEPDSGSGAVALKILSPAVGNERDRLVLFEPELRAAQGRPDEQLWMPESRRVQALGCPDREAVRPRRRDCRCANPRWYRRSRRHGWHGRHKRLGLGKCSTSASLDVAPEDE